MKDEKDEDDYVDDDNIIYLIIYLITGNKQTLISTLSAILVNRCVSVSKILLEPNDYGTMIPVPNHRARGQTQHPWPHPGRDTCWKVETKLKPGTH